VALVADTNPDFVRFFFACQYAGLTPVPLPAQLQLGARKAYVTQLKRLLADCQAEMAMAPDAFLSFLTEAAEGLDLRFLGTPRDYDVLAETHKPLNPAEPTDLAYLQYTSGSTRFPRGVMISQKAVLSNLMSIIQEGVMAREGDRAVSWLPFFHDMGLVGLLLCPMATQASVDFLNTLHFAMRPRTWLKLMSENRGTVSISPPFGYELTARRFRDEDVDKYDLSSWRIAGVGAEMIHPESLRSFADNLFHLLQQLGLPFRGGFRDVAVDGEIELHRERVIPVADPGLFEALVGEGRPARRRDEQVFRRGVGARPAGYGQGYQGQ